MNPVRWAFFVVANNLSTSVFTFSFILASVRFSCIQRPRNLKCSLLKGSTSCGLKINAISLPAIVSLGSNAEYAVGFLGVNFDLSLLLNCLKARLTHFFGFAFMVLVQLSHFWVVSRARWFPCADFVTRQRSSAYALLSVVTLIHLNWYPSWDSGLRISNRSWKTRLNRSGDRTHPWKSPMRYGKKSVSQSLEMTFACSFS